MDAHPNDPAAATSNPAIATQGKDSPELRVELRKGALEAIVHASSGRFELEAATRQVLARLKQLGAVNGVEPERVRQALSALLKGGAPGEGVVVARGQPPRAGINAQILPLFPVRHTPLGEDTDPFAAYAGNVVYPGQAILQKTPPSPGIPGKSLLGTPLPAADGTDIPISISSGVAKDDDGKTFRSTCYGVVLFQRGQLMVADALHVSEDRMEARLSVLPDSRVSEAEQLAQVLGALKALEVSHGVDREALVETVRTSRAENRTVPDVVVARGKEPVDGREPSYRTLFDVEKKVGKVLDGNRIDFREAEMVKNVSKGDPLAEVVPGVEPVPGFRVDGTTLRPRIEKAQGLKPGQNTVPSEDGRKILADADGMVVLQRGQFHIADEYIVQGDVDYRTGNIRASGAVHIRGQVKPGFQVQGGKGVEILKDVEDALVESASSITVRGGITAGSRIVAGDKVTAKYVQNSRIETETDLEVKLSVANSEVYAKGKVIALSGQGAILGGEVNAAMGIEARTIGAPSSKTHVAVGVDLRVVREIEKIEGERSAVLEELKRIQSNLGTTFLKDPRAALAAMPAGLRKGKLEMLQRMKALYQQDRDLSSKRDELAQVSEKLQNASIAVQGEIHAGTHLTVARACLCLPETLRHVLIYYSAEQKRIAWRKL